jgi:hypothetical protein
LPRTPACLRIDPPAPAELYRECRSPGCTGAPGPAGWCPDHDALFAQIRKDIEMDFRHGCPRRLVGRDRHTRRIGAARSAESNGAQSGGGVDRQHPGGRG